MIKVDKFIFRIGRAVTLFSLFLMPSYAHDMGGVLRFSIGAALVVTFLGLLILPNSGKYLCTLSGRLELIGGFALLGVMGLTGLAVYFNGSSDIGVLIGGGLGLIYFAAMGFCFFGLLCGAKAR